MRPRQQTSPGIAPQAAANMGISEVALPESDGWDAADTATHIPDDDTKTLVRDQPPVEEITAAPPPVKEREPEKAPEKAPEKPKEKTVTSVLAATPIAPSVVTKPAGTSSGAAAAIANVMPSAVPVTAAMREEVWTIVRAAVDQAVAPLGTRIKELESRLERAEKSGVAAAKPPPAGPAQASSATSRLASIPVTGVSSIPPSLSPGAATSVTFTDADVKSVRPSMPVTNLGIVVVPPGPRPAVDLEAIAKQPTTDIEWNPAGNKRMVGRVVVVLMILAVGAAVVLTIMSHSGPH